MDTFAPEFCRFWLPEAGEEGEGRIQAANDEDVREREALAELVERVNAARSVV
jgi:hypothetical protein